MAAGDVIIHKVIDRGDGIQGHRVVYGTVQLDGANPTPVALAAYLSAVEGAALTLVSSSAPADDPSWVSYNPNGTTLDVYAWKNTGGTDPTLVASTNNAAIFSFIAWGPKA